MSGTPGAPVGNTNAKRGAEWREAIKRALTRASERLGNGDEIGYRRGLDLVADKFIAAASDGEAWAIKELGDRMDGKPHQSIVADISATVFVDRPLKKVSAGKSTD